MSGAPGSALVLATGLLLSACAEPSTRADPRPTPSHAVVGGELSDGDPAVVAIVQRRTACEASAVVECSGALIAPRVVLTAAHCLQRGPFTRFEVFFGQDLQGEGTFVPATLAEAWPGFDPEGRGGDLALLLLADPVEVPPLPLAPPELLVEPGLVARVVGFGDSHDPERSLGLKRTGTTQVEEVQDEVFRTSPAPAMTCVGDSGGPVLLLDDEGDEVLVAVTSSGDPACADHAWSAKVLPFLELFLEPFLEAADEGPDGWTDALLEPDGLCEAPCEDDHDCPAALVCMPGPDGAACLLPGLSPGDFGEACHTDLECGPEGSCERLWAEDCRCHRPCGAESPPPANGGDDTGEQPDPADPPPCGCGGGVSPSWLALLVPLAATRRYTFRS